MILQAQFFCQTTCHIHSAGNPESVVHFIETVQFFQCVTEGMTEIQHGTQGGFLFILCHHIRFQLTGSLQHFFKKFRIFSADESKCIFFQYFKKIFIEGCCYLDDLGKPQRKIMT